MTWRRLVRVMGAVLVSSGVLGLLFVAFQLWGTTLFEGRHQANLRRQFEHALRAPGRSRPGAVLSPTSPGGTPGGATPRPVPAMVDPAPGSPVGEIRIPAIGLDQVVVEGVAEAELSLGPGHYPGTPLPGEAGNVGIAGHRTTWGHPFYSLDRLRAGDPIVITTVQGTFTYDTTGSQVVAPSDVAVLDPTAAPELTLTTCNPRYSAAQRLVVRARLVAVAAPAQAVARATRPVGGSSPRESSGRHAARNLASSRGSWAGALGWGLGVCVAATALAASRHVSAPWWRRLATGGAVLGLLVPLFFFYAALSLILPASF